MGIDRVRPVHRQRGLTLSQEVWPRLLDETGHHDLRTFVATGDAAPIFTGPKGALLRRSNFQPHGRKALAAAGLHGVHFHDLRHTGNTLTAQAGATLPDLMARMGHASPRAALIYLHTTSTRDRAVAAALDVLVQRDRARNGHAAEERPKGTTKPQVR